jgi:hypothetical protein
MGQRIIELKWNCSECDSVGILGRHKKCPNCGAPRERGEMQMSGLGSSAGESNTAATVTDSDLLALAKAGADWFCTHCESGNRGDVQSCQACGSARTGEADEGYTPQSSDIDSSETTDKIEKKQPAKRKLGRWILAVLGACLFVGIGLVWWALSSYDTAGEVTTLSWRHTTIRQAWTQVQRGAWKMDTTITKEVAPLEGDGERAGMVLVQGSCQEKHHRDERYVCGSHEECTTDYTTESYACGETCTDDGNGFATCTTDYCTNQVASGETCRTVDDYCSRPIYETWCTYNTQSWQHSATDRHSGSNHETTWPTLDAGPLDRLRFTARYDVQVNYGDEEPFMWHPGGDEESERTRQKRDLNLDDYLSSSLGEAVQVRRLNIGPVSALIRADGTVLKVN